MDDLPVLQHFRDCPEIPKSDRRRMRCIHCHSLFSRETRSLLRHLQRFHTGDGHPLSQNEYEILAEASQRRRSDPADATRGAAPARPVLGVGVGASIAGDLCDIQGTLTTSLPSLLQPESRERSLLRSATPVSLPMPTQDSASALYNRHFNLESSFINDSLADISALAPSRLPLPPPPPPPPAFTGPTTPVITACRRSDVPVHAAIIARGFPDCETLDSLLGLRPGPPLSVATARAAVARAVAAHAVSTRFYALWFDDTSAAMDSVDVRSAHATFIDFPLLRLSFYLGHAPRATVAALGDALTRAGATALLASPGTVAAPWHLHDPANHLCEAVDAFASDDYLLRCTSHVAVRPAPGEGRLSLRLRTLEAIVGEINSAKLAQRVNDFQPSDIQHILGSLDIWKLLATGLIECSKTLISGTAFDFVCSVGSLLSKIQSNTSPMVAAVADYLDECISGLDAASSPAGPAVHALAAGAGFAGYFHNDQHDIVNRLASTFGDPGSVARVVDLAAGSGPDWSPLPGTLARALQALQAVRVGAAATRSRLRRTGLSSVLSVQTEAHGEELLAQIIERTWDWSSDGLYGTKQI